MLALTWDDLNIKTGELQINKTIAKSDHYYVSNTPKQKSNRTLILDAKTITILKMEIRAKNIFLNLVIHNPHVFSPMKKMNLQ